MLEVGIDSLYFYTPPYCLPLSTLAEVRGEEPTKYQQKLGQVAMGIPSPDEDVITLGVNAALPLVTNNDLEGLDTLLFATESSIDQSKAGGVYLQQLLNLPNHMRVVELKQACYSATMALQMAIDHIHRHPHAKVLIVATDIARYGFNTPGESSQGSGAIAMLITAKPRLLVIEAGSGIYTKEVMDFWRPPYRDEAFVDGYYSSKCYLLNLEKTWRHYQATTQRTFNDHDYFCYHVPVPKLVEKAHKYLCQLNDKNDFTNSFIQQVQPSLIDCALAGNCYSASLYLALLSLLIHGDQDLTHKRIGLYSYGSGSVAEYFSGVVQKDYQSHLDPVYQNTLLKNRQLLKYEQYEQFYHYKLPQDGSRLTIPVYLTQGCRLTHVQDHKRYYTVLK